MTYVVAGLIGAALGMLLAYVVVALTVRSERRKRGGDISEAIREEMRAHPEFQRGYSEAIRGARR